MTLKQWLVLNKIYELNSMAVYRLIEQIGYDIDIFRMTKSDFVHNGFSENIFDVIKNFNFSIIENELLWAEKENNYIVTLEDDKYPVLLSKIDTPPLVLYISGNVECLNKLQLAIVGSRNPSPIGFEIAEHFANYLSKQDLVITSGLAVGIDSASHIGAMGSGDTIAVLGSGLKNIYPYSNKDLADEISKCGALVSEFSLKTPPKKENFPRRNRIISGLSLGVLVVEAALKSGSLITANFAIDQGREVFAIPGSIHNPLARGCHHLIKKGAKLVEKASDIIEELRALSNFVKEDKNQKIKQQEKNNLINLDNDHIKLLSYIGYETTSVDTIILRSGFLPKVVSSMLLMLELEGYIKSVSGGYCKLSNGNKL